MYGKAAMVFNEAFPYIGNENIEEVEQEELSEKEQYLKMAEEQFDKEKRTGIKSLFCERIRRGIKPWYGDY